MNEAEFIAKAEGLDKVQQVVAFKNIQSDRQIVYGQVYVPNILDTHGEMMLPEAVEQMGHRFMATLKNDQIDLMHNNRVVKATVIESWIQREESDMYTVGAWVIGLKIDDSQLWTDIKSGKYNGFSVDTWITKVDATVEVTFLPQVFGFTQKTDGHEHAFFIQVDEFGNIEKGWTSVEKDGDGNLHSHSIIYGTATELTNMHGHRFELP